MYYLAARSILSKREFSSSALSRWYGDFHENRIIYKLNKRKSKGKNRSSSVASVLDFNSVKLMQISFLSKFKWRSHTYMYIHSWWEWWWLLSSSWQPLILWYRSLNMLLPPYCDLSSPLLCVAPHSILLKECSCHLGPELLESLINLSLQRNVQTEKYVVMVALESKIKTYGSPSPTHTHTKFTFTHEHNMFVALNPEFN